MVSYLMRTFQSSVVVPVLILIVVDNGLVPLNGKATGIKFTVLILIVVDNGLVHDGNVVFGGGNQS